MYIYILDKTESLYTQVCCLPPLPSIAAIDCDYLPSPWYIARSIADGTLDVEVILTPEDILTNVDIPEGNVEIPEGGGAEGPPPGTGGAPTRARSVVPNAIPEGGEGGGGGLGCIRIVGGNAIPEGGRDGGFPPVRRLGNAAGKRPLGSNNRDGESERLVDRARGKTVRR